MSKKGLKAFAYGVAIAAIGAIGAIVAEKVRDYMRKDKAQA
ncbi:hypothetical protein [Pseudoalteromonas rhizosphaerae]|uniref:Uncharacterized protein n=1 Tax=Pseudoalteromonas rhizosphaerae TaxID=2518973 RepID=A0ABW8KZG0_9GAMM